MKQLRKFNNKDEYILNYMSIPIPNIVKITNNTDDIDLLDIYTSIEIGDNLNNIVIAELTTPEDNLKIGICEVAYADNTNTYISYPSAIFKNIIIDGNDIDLSLLNNNTDEKLGTYYIFENAGKHNIIYVLKNSDSLSYTSINNANDTITPYVFLTTGLYNSETLSYILPVSFIITNSITTFGTYCFSNPGITDIIIKSNNLNYIGERCFYNCIGIKTIDLSNSNITTLLKYCFNGCTNLTNIILPNSLTTFETSIFKNCISLETIQLPHTVTNIGNYVFKDCTKLKLIIYDGTLEEWNSIAKGTSYITQDTTLLYNIDNNTTGVTTLNVTK